MFSMLRSLKLGAEYDLISGSKNVLTKQNLNFESQPFQIFLCVRNKKYIRQFVALKLIAFDLPFLESFNDSVVQVDLHSIFE